MLDDLPRIYIVKKSPALMAAVLISGLVLICAAGLYAVGFRQASADCAASLGMPCGMDFSLSFGVSAVSASIAGLVLTVGLALALGMDWHRDGAPNTALALKIADEEGNLQDYRLRRAQLDEWTHMAAARAAEKAAADAAAAQAAAEAEAAFLAEASRWIEEEEEEQPETAEDERRRVLAEHMAHLARVKPEAIAEVLKMWINQPVR
jgi:hypothetical protein